MVYERLDLPAGPHTVVLRHTGRKNPLSQDTFVLIDRVDILGAAPAAADSTGSIEVKVTGLPNNLTPATGIGAVSLNVAVTNPDAAGFFDLLFERLATLA